MYAAMQLMYISNSGNPGEGNFAGVLSTQGYAKFKELPA